MRQLVLSRWVLRAGQSGGHPMTSVREVTLLPYVGRADPTEVAGTNRRRRCTRCVREPRALESHRERVRARLRVHSTCEWPCKSAFADRVVTAAHEAPAQCASEKYRALRRTVRAYR